jgi:hypothetical protein
MTNQSMWLRQIESTSQPILLSLIELEKCCCEFSTYIRYSCDPHKHVTVFLKYPYVLYETMIPLSIYLWFKNPLEIAWYWNNLFVYLPSFLWIPRMWYYEVFIKVLEIIAIQNI